MLTILDFKKISTHTYTRTHSHTHTVLRCRARVGFVFLRLGPSGNTPALAGGVGAGGRRRVYETF